MADLSAFPITQRWAPEYPGRIQLYSMNTPNGVKAAIMLEECGLAYEPHLIDIGADESHAPEFVSLNPNGKIPAIIDPDGPGGQPLGLFESGAIMLYLAEKTGRFLDPGRRWETIAWVMWQMGGLGPMAGQLGFFHKFAGKDFEDKRPRDRYVGEVKRLLGVLDRQLEGREWIVGDYSIADIASIGWVRTIPGLYDAGAITGFDGFANVRRWLDAGLARPAVKRGLAVTSKTGKAL
jgi:GST-like protein